MSINSRIKSIRDEFCAGDNAEFAKILGTSKQYASNISNEGKNVGDKVLDKILKLFPDVNPIWLKMGEGDMLKTGSINVKGDNNVSNTGVIGGNINSGKYDGLVEILIPEEYGSTGLKNLSLDQFSDAMFKSLKRLQDQRTELEKRVIELEGELKTKDKEIEGLKNELAIRVEMITFLQTKK